jgi:hypothetical protein
MQRYISAILLRPLVVFGCGFGFELSDGGVVSGGNAVDPGLVAAFRPGVLNVRAQRRWNPAPRQVPSIIGIASSLRSSQ